MHIDDALLPVLNMQGYVLVPDFLSAAELQRCTAELSEYFPTSDELRRDPQRAETVRHARPFPFAGRTLNHTVAHPDLVSFLHRFFGTSDLRLGSAFVQAKYGTVFGESRDQQLHNDMWGRNSLVHPRTDGIYRRVYTILYLSDVTVDLAPTYVVPAEHSRHVPLLSDSGRALYGKDSYPELYDHALPVTASAGSLLLFLGNTVHGGSSMCAEYGHRFALFTNFHTAAACWLDKHSWMGDPASPDAPQTRSFIETASPSQRQLLGFPPPGDAYWNAETLRGMADLYPGIDLDPYARSLGEK